MVCLRDKITLQTVLNNQGLNYRFSVHGAIEILEDSAEVEYQKLKKRLEGYGLILLDEKESKVIDQIINTIVEIIHYTDELPKLSFTDILSKYAVSGKESILKIFSDVKGMSVLQFIVKQKIERAKELMLYEDMSYSEIAEILNYKNESYFSAQFKKVTGLTPSYFMQLRQDRLNVAKNHKNSVQSELSEMNSQ